MELKDFVSETFKQIIDGVKDSRSIGDEASGIASNERFRIERLHPNLMQDHVGALYTVVEFDVAVTAGAKVEGGGGVDVYAFKLKGGLDTHDETVSRVKFSIPMKFNIY
ncbi:hypothetical protein ELI41_29620 (plasmid) [Rhizobium leguminosarum]|jgi:hypothetical protein|uniref:hypothetical protein n=1 Tax=Rhizobium leguminosarum TaxID=384 RepID=UPI0010307952|nr:hypothetical protein [Rhizobium leguminosarum]TAU80468.1 hypothetical protein ELI41_29620 [Rhizobium leguminosarum]